MTIWKTGDVITASGLNNTQILNQLSPSREISSIYQNISGKVAYVNAIIETGTYMYTKGFVGDSSPPTIEVDRNFNYNVVSGVGVNIRFFVLPQQYYSIHASGSNLGYVRLWREWI